MSSKRPGQGARLSLVQPQADDGERDRDALDASDLLDGSAVVESGASDYAQLTQGKIDVDEYMTLTIDRAVAHLVGQLPDQQIEGMRQVLRSALLDDPYLSSLAAQAASASHG